MPTSISRWSASPVFVLAVAAVACSPERSNPPGGGADMRSPVDGGGADGLAPLVLTVVSAQNARVRAGDSTSCAVKATRGGSPVAGVAVSFVVAAGEGRSRPAMVPTGADGVAMTAWQLGFTGKGQSLQASAPGAAPVSCLADATARPLDFAAPTSVPAGTRPYAMAFARLDDDHLPDLVVTLGDGNVGVGKNAGNGNFTAFQAWKAGAGPEGIAIGRFNGDAYDDVAVANSLSSSVSVFLGAAGDQLMLVANYGVDNGPTDVACADLDGDGKQDLAVSAKSVDAITFLSGAGNGMFTRQMPSLPTGNAPSGIGIGDLNGDAGRQGGEFAKPDLLDLVVAQNQRAMGSNNDTVRVMLGGAGFAVGRADEYMVEQSPIDVALGDLDGDGKTDAAVANTAPTGSISVLIGNGNGGFAMPKSVALENVPGLIAMGDVDGDGAQDLVVPVGGNTRKLVVLLNDGSGQLKPQDHVLAASPVAALLGDINDDGLPDMLALAGPNVLIFLRK